MINKIFKCLINYQNKKLYDIIKPNSVNWTRVNQNLTGKEVQFKINFLILGKICLEKSLK